jgi:preprotein translocase subunit SecE
MTQNKSVQKTRRQGENFFEEIKAELKRVTWPDKKAIINATVVIIIIVTVSTLYVSAIDWVLSRFASLWLKL